MNRMIPEYSTVTFTDVWDDVEKFRFDLSNSPFGGYLHQGETDTTDPLHPIVYPDSVGLIFYLLYSRYGNNPIANRDINQWKFKVFSVIFQYGPTWEKRLDIQEKLRDISDDDLLLGAKAIYNTALNPSTTPSTGSLDELTYINSQNTTNYKKSKMEAYSQLLELLEVDVTEEFLVKFKKCFKVFVAPEKPLLYVTDTEDEEIVEGD